MASRLRRCASRMRCPRALWNFSSAPSTGRIFSPGQFRNICAMCWAGFASCSASSLSRRRLRRAVRGVSIRPNPAPARPAPASPSIASLKAKLGASWKWAAAAFLVLLVLGMGGYIFHQLSSVKPPAPQNADSAKRNCLRRPSHRKQSRLCRQPSQANPWRQALPAPTRRNRNPPTSFAKPLGVKRNSPTPWA